MRWLALALLVGAAPTGPATRLVAIWLDRGSPYMELRPDGTGRIGALENTWGADKEKIQIRQVESGDSFEIPYTIEGAKLKLVVQGLQVELEKSKQKPAAHPPPPPKPPSQLNEPPDAGSPKKKKGKK